MEWTRVARDISLFVKAPGWGFNEQQGLRLIPAQLRTIQNLEFLDATSLR